MKKSLMILLVFFTFFSLFLPVKANLEDCQNNPYSEDCKEACQENKDSCYYLFPEVFCEFFPDDERCPQTVFSGGGMDKGLEILEKEVKKDTGVITERGIVKVILAWVKFFLVIAGVVAFAGLVYAGFLYLTAFTNEENGEKAKKIIIFTIIGIIVILFSYVIVDLFISAEF